MEQDFLQNVKLEISRTINLTPYERIAFHRVLGIEKTRNGLDILLSDFKHKGAIRLSAMNIMKDFDYSEVDELFNGLLSENISSDELIMIFEHIWKFGSDVNIEPLMKFISANITNIDNNEFVSKAVELIGKIGENSPEISDYLKDIAINTEYNSLIRESAIVNMKQMRDVSFFESLLQEKNEAIDSAVYKAIAMIAEREYQKFEENITDDIYTVVPPKEDKLFLDLRVLLSKMTPMFDGYSNETKTDFILAMLYCIHREFLIYAMKALTSNDTELIDMTLYVLLTNISKVRFPDKLFRNLISLSSLTARDDELIIEIFIKYFTGLKETRSNHLLKDKIYNYIVVMMDTFFETYRKNYMVTEIAEKDFPVEVQKLRQFFLKRFTPDLKRRIVNILNDNDHNLRNLLFDISDKISSVEESEYEALKYFVEIMLEKDQKAREISASRINSIDFEKKYLKNKIIRLCRIIGKLRISDASSNLVKILNYILKYYDNDIFEAVAYALAMLNYPYMLGELEVSLNTVSGDSLRTIKFISLFTDQRSLNILIDYLKDNHKDTSEIIGTIMFSIMKRDVKKNKSAAEAAKLIIAENNNPQYKKQALHLLGKVRDEADIDYLDDLFKETTDPLVKEGIVQSFDFLIKTLDNNNKLRVVKLIKEYLKDPGIRIRIYSCIILIKLGDKSALYVLKDMMIIKNRSIQQEILNIMGSHINVEFAFFLLSLMKEEYSIAQDITPLFYYLEKEDRLELDHFISNLYKKIDGTEYSPVRQTAMIELKQQLKHFRHENMIIMAVEVLKFYEVVSQYQYTDMFLNFNDLFMKIVRIINENEGEISSATCGSILAIFNNSLRAAAAASEIIEFQKGFNNYFTDEEQVNLLIYLDYRELDYINQEIVFYQNRHFIIARTPGLKNRIILNNNLYDHLEKSYRCSDMPSSSFDGRGYAVSYKELLGILNFNVKVDEFMVEVREEERKKIEMQYRLEEEMQSRKGRVSDKAIALAKTIEDLNKMLKKDLNEVNKYVTKRSTDRELIFNVEKLLHVAYNHFVVESSKMIVE